MIYRTRIDAVEKLLDSKEIKYTGEVISLSEFEDIICHDIKEYGLLDKFNSLKEKFNEEQVKLGIFEKVRSISNPTIRHSSFYYEKGCLAMKVCLKNYDRFSINADKNGIENFESKLKKKKTSYIKEFILDNKDELNNFLFDVMDYADSFNAELNMSSLSSEHKFDFSKNLFSDKWVSYNFKMNDIMHNPKVSFDFRESTCKPIFIDNFSDPRQIVENNQEAIKKRTPIEINKLNPAFVKKIEKYR